jgi:hypothetical protein
MMSLLLPLLLACAGPSGDLEAVTFTVNPRVTTVINAAWTSAEGGEAFLEWGLDDRLTERTQSAQVEAGEHKLRLIGPAAGSQVFVRAVVETDDGDRLTSAVHVLNLPLAPAGMGAVYAEGAPSQTGSLLTTIVKEQPWVVLLNTDGEPIWYYALPGRSITTATQPARDGEGLLVLVVEQQGPKKVVQVIRVSWDGELVGAMEIPDGHHDFRELPDGRIAWVQPELRELIVDGEPMIVMGDNLRLSAWGEDASATPTEPPLLSLFDALPPPGNLCDHHARPTEFNGELVLDWSHINSIDYDPDTDELILLAHFVDTLVSVPVTGGEAKVVSTVAGYTTEDGELPFSHAHSSMMRSDHALLFDNGLHYVPPLSRLVSLSWDERDQTLWEDWSYEDPDAGVVQVLGDAQPTPQGGALASYSTHGRIIEVTERGEVLWTLETEAGAGFGRLRWMEGF